MKEKLLSNTQTSFDDIKESYARICENIEKAKTAAGRTDDVRLMAVTKTVDPERINYAVGLGIDLLGENRVQEFLDKRESYSPAEVHFIGGLQTNKVKYIIDKVSMIHSVDSVHLAEEISRRAGQHGLDMDILAEINIGGEETKGGITPESAAEFCAQIGELPHIRLRGLMTYRRLAAAMTLLRLCSAFSETCVLIRRSPGPAVSILSPWGCQEITKRR